MMKLFEDSISLFSKRKYSELASELKLLTSEKTPSFSEFIKDPIFYHQKLHFVFTYGKVIVTRKSQFNTLPGFGMNVRIVGHIIEQPNGVCIKCRIIPHMTWQLLALITSSIASWILISSLFFSPTEKIPFEYWPILALLVLLYLFIWNLKKSILRLFIRALDLTEEGCT